MERVSGKKLLYAMLGACLSATSAVYADDRTYVDSVLDTDCTVHVKISDGADWTHIRTLPPKALEYALAYSDRMKHLSKLESAASFVDAGMTGAAGARDGAHYALLVQLGTTWTKGVQYLPKRFQKFFIPLSALVGFFGSGGASLTCQHYGISWCSGTNKLSAEEKEAIAEAAQEAKRFEVFRDRIPTTIRTWQAKTPSLEIHESRCAEFIWPQEVIEDDNYIAKLIAALEYGERQAEIVRERGPINPRTPPVSAPIDDSPQWQIP